MDGYTDLRPKVRCPSQQTLLGVIPGSPAKHPHPKERSQPQNTLLCYGLPRVMLASPAKKFARGG